MSDNLDAEVAKRFPREWARANDPALRNRSKARNNLRKRCKAAVAFEAFREANPQARCANCDNGGPSRFTRGALICLLDSDFHGDQPVHLNNVCVRWKARLDNGDQHE